MSFGLLFPHLLAPVLMVVADWVGGGRCSRRWRGAAVDLWPHAYFDDLVLDRRANISILIRL